MYVAFNLRSDYLFILQMRVEGLSANKTAHFSVILEVGFQALLCSGLPSTRTFKSNVKRLNFSVVWLKVFEVAPTFLMVDIQKAAGDASDYLKVSCVNHLSFACQMCF